MKLIWAPLAVKRVEEFARYIAKDKPAAAEKWVEEIFKAVKRLEKQPKSGRVLPETNNPLIRQIIYKSHRIIYRIHPTFISILTVRHQRSVDDSELG